MLPYMNGGDCREPRRLLLGQRGAPRRRWISLIRIKEGRNFSHDGNLTSELELALGNGRKECAPF